MAPSGRHSRFPAVNRSIEERRDLGEPIPVTGSGPVQEVDVEALAPEVVEAPPASEPTPEVPVDAPTPEVPVQEPVDVQEPEVETPDDDESTDSTGEASDDEALDYPAEADGLEWRVELTEDEDEPLDA